MGKQSKPQVTGITPEVQEIGRGVSEFLIPRIGQGATPFGQETVAGLIPELQGVAQQLGQVDLTQFLGQQEGALQRALSGVPAANLGPRETARFFQKAVATPLLRTFDTEIAPRIAEGFAGGGATFSSQRGRAQREALEDLQTQLAGGLGQFQLSNQQFNAGLQESALQRQLQAVGIAEQQALAPLNRLSSLTQALGPFQQQAQAERTGGFNEFLRLTEEADPFLQFGLGTIGKSEFAAQPGQQLFSGGGALAGSILGNAIFPGAGTALGFLAGGFGG